ncbi:putative oxidoreductase CipA-like protein [Hypoxylon sp. NC1633]|nr:putative oxidoreductase CipA-like protein [Hypoxylon sp. NC1633]
MSTISKVAIAGATGNLGPAVLNRLVEDGFKVTALTRKGTSHSFPSSVAVVEIDYESPESLVKALKGQDALVSVIGYDGMLQQLPLIEAAVEAGVKRVIPSEFGWDAENEKTLELRPFQSKKTVSEAVKKLAASGSLTYSFISNGPFLDLGLHMPFIVDLKGRSAILYNGGDRPFSTTLIPDVAKAVSGVLKHPEETKNRNVFVHSALLTQNKVLELSKKLFGSEGWQTTTTETDALLKKANADLEEGKVDRFGFIASIVWGEGYGSIFEKVDNELLGIKELDDEGLKNLLASVAKDIGAA